MTRQNVCTRESWARLTLNDSPLEHAFCTGHQKLLIPTNVLQIRHQQHAHPSLQSVDGRMIEHGVRADRFSF